MPAGYRVAEEREGQGMSQQELADRVTRLGYKISQTGIDKMEKRDSKRPKCLKELALALDVTQEWILSGIEPRRVPPDFKLQEIGRDFRRLKAEQQERLFKQIRSLLDIAMEEDIKSLK